MKKNWNNEETGFLRKNYNLHNSELATILNRSIESIKSRAKKLQLKKERVYSIGDKFNGLTLIDRPFFNIINNVKRRFGIFLCRCGEMKEIRLDNVTSGKTKSCGKCKDPKNSITFFVQT